MTWLDTNKRLKKRVAELEAENEQLRYKAERYDVILGAKREWNAKRRNLFQYVHYQNWMGRPRRLWPAVLCNECKHVKGDGDKHHEKFKCSQLGTRVGKYSSCDWAEKQT